MLDVTDDKPSEATQSAGARIPKFSDNVFKYARVIKLQIGGWKGTQAGR
jgi:hypothetical protein